MLEIAFVNDTHFDEDFPKDHDVDSQQNWIRVIADLEARNIKRIIFGGDIGKSRSHAWFFESLKPFSYQLILGNHDTFKEVTKYYKGTEEAKDLYYYSEENEYKFIFLDTSTDELSSTQLTWLREQLKTKKKLILFLHHPVIAVDTPIDKEYPLKNRQQLKLLLLDHEKPITIFCAHYHMNDERSYQNLTQIITPAVSYQIDKNASEVKVDNTHFGYRILRFQNDKVETEIVKFASGDKN